MIVFGKLGQDGCWEEREGPRLCSFGLTEVLAPIIAEGLGGLGVGAATAGTLSTGLVDAGLGAGVSALTGRNPLQGAVIGGLGGMANGALGGAAGAGATQPVPGGSMTNAAGMQGNSMADFQGGGGAADNNAVGPGQMAAPGGALVQNAGLAARQHSPLGGLNGLQGLTQFLASPKPVSTAPGVQQLGPYFNKQLQPTGNLNRSLTPNFQPASGNWQTYGQTPEPAFYSGNNVTGFARGGALTQHMALGGRGVDFDSSRGDFYVGGETPGQDDSRNARLSDGEVVFDAGSVSAIGDGNNAAGARRLLAMRDQIAKDKGFKHTVQPKLKKSPLQYLKQASSK